MMGNFLNRFDGMICRYLGIMSNESDRPRSIKIMGNNVFIVKNMPFQRHKSYETLSDFNDHGINETNDINKKKIGMAAGKAIAKNLKITFDKLEIKES